VLDELMPIAQKHGIQMRCCGNKGLVGYPLVKNEDDSAMLVTKRDRDTKEASSLPIVGQSRCVDAQLADRIAREKGIPILLNPTKDLAQREACECHRSTDIGQYSFQCPHACVYCYANPMKKSQALTHAQQNPIPAAGAESGHAESTSATPSMVGGVTSPATAEGHPPQLQSDDGVPRRCHVELPPFVPPPLDASIASPSAPVANGNGLDLASGVGMAANVDFASSQPPPLPLPMPDCAVSANDLLQRVYGGFNYLSLMTPQQQVHM